jgi:hypothetical protein
LGYKRALVDCGVVVIVSVAVPALAPVIETGVVVPNENVGRSAAPVGLEVRAAVSATLPVNPPLGVTVIVEVFPVAAPGARVSAVPTIAKLGGGGAVTVTGSVPLAARYCESPLYEAVTVSFPTASVFAGMVKLADPALNATGDDMYAPLERVTVPVASPR